MTAGLPAIAFGDYNYYNIGDRGTRSFAELKELFAGNGMVGFVAKERVDGKLVLSGERTESCQYYAFFCDVATPESHPDLWNTLVYEFGYDRKEKGLYPEIWPANAFIGNYLRLDLLNRYDFKKELYDNIKGYFTYMADQTGTLWEHDGSGASCNHGFASHVIYWMNELGLLAHDYE